MPSSPALAENRVLVRLGNRPAADFLERRRRHRLHAETHRAQTGGVHDAQQFRVEPIEPRFALEGVGQPTGADGVAHFEHAIALLREERIAKDDVRRSAVFLEIRQFLDHARHRPGSIGRLDPVRAVGAELRAAPRRQHRQRASVRPAGKRDPPATLRRQQRIPLRKRQRVQVVDLRTRHCPAQPFAGKQPHQRRLGLTADDEVRRVLEQVRQLLRSESDESDAHAGGAHRARPRRLTAVVDKRRQDDRHVAIDGLTIAAHNLVTRRWPPRPPHMPGARSAVHEWHPSSGATTRVTREKGRSLDPYPPTTVSLLIRSSPPLMSAKTTRIGFTPRSMTARACAAGSTVDLGKMPGRSLAHRVMATRWPSRTCDVTGELEPGECGRRARNERECRGRRSRTSYGAVRLRNDHGLRWLIGQHRAKRQQGASIDGRRIGIVVLGVLTRVRKHVRRRRRVELRCAAIAREVIKVMREHIGLMFAGSCTERQQQDTGAKQPERPDGPDGKGKHLASYHLEYTRARGRLMMLRH